MIGLNDVNNFVPSERLTKQILPHLMLRLIENKSGSEPMMCDEVEHVVA